MKIVMEITDKIIRLSNCDTREVQEYQIKASIYSVEDELLRLKKAYHLAKQMIKNS